MGKYDEDLPKAVAEAAKFAKNNPLPDCKELHDELDPLADAVHKMLATKIIDVVDKVLMLGLVDPDITGELVVAVGRHIIETGQRVERFVKEEFLPEAEKRKEEALKPRPEVF